MVAKTKSGKDISDKEKLRFSSDINEIRKTIHGKWEKKEVLTSLRRALSSADKMKTPPGEMTDLLDEIFNLYPLQDSAQNEEYISLLKSLIEKGDLDHSWIGEYYKRFKTNPLIGLTIKLIEKGELEIALGLMEKFRDKVFKADNIIETLRLRKVHEDFASQLEKKAPKFEDINKSLSDRSVSSQVVKSFNESYRMGKELWPIQLGKKRVIVNMGRYRPDHQKYLKALKEQHTDVYNLLFIQEAYFYLSMPTSKRKIEALPRMVSDFRVIEMFMKRMIKLPAGYPSEKGRPKLGDYIRYLDENPRKLDDNWRKFYWKSSYVHKNAMAVKGKRYSLYEGLNQFKEWQNGKIKTSLDSKDFAQNKVHPFTYELLCDLMDAFSCVPSKKG